MRINQNISALNSYRNLSSTNNVMGKSLEKLSSGFRINRAADDAAGLVISQGLRAQVSGLRQATRNAQDGISVVQTAEGALTEVHTMLNRMRDLAVQSANTGSSDTAAREAAQNEFSELSAEIDRISTTTKFGTKSLLDGTYGNQNATVKGASFDASSGIAIAAGGGFGLTLTSASGATPATTQVVISAAAATFTNASDYQAAIQTGIDAQAALAGVTASVKDNGSGEWGVSFTYANNATGAQISTVAGTTDEVADIGGAVAGTAVTANDTGTFQVGANSGETISVGIAQLDAGTLGITGLNLVTGASAAIDTLDAAIGQVSDVRGELGGKQNRFESTINNLQVTTENLAASESRIRDTDMALEMVSFTRHQILMQAGTAMLGQANQLPQGVLRLLG